MFVVRVLQKTRVSAYYRSGDGPKWPPIAMWRGYALLLCNIFKEIDFLLELLTLFRP
jgi:hypothetical protein